MKQNIVGFAGLSLFLSGQIIEQRTCGYYGSINTISHLAFLSLSRISFLDEVISSRLSIVIYIFLVYKQD